MLLLEYVQFPTNISIFALATNVSGVFKSAIAFFRANQYFAVLCKHSKLLLTQIERIWVLFIASGIFDSHLFIYKSSSGQSVIFEWHPSVSPYFVAMLSFGYYLKIAEVLRKFSRKDVQEICVSLLHSFAFCVKFCTQILSLAVRQASDPFLQRFVLSRSWNVQLGVSVLMQATVGEIKKWYGAHICSADYRDYGTKKGLSTKALAKIKSRTGKVDSQHDVLQLTMVVSF